MTLVHIGVCKIVCNLCVLYAIKAYYNDLVYKSRIHFNELPVHFLF